MLIALNRTGLRRPRRRSVQLVPVLLDEGVSFGTEPVACDSVLALPLGTGSVLTGLLGELAGHGLRTARVVSDQSAAFLGRPNVATADTSFRVVRPTEAASEIAASETSDYLMIIRARYWPMSGHCLDELARTSMRFRGATHVVAVAASAPVARERLVCATDGRVRRVNRLYDAMNWPEAARSMVVCSLVPAHVLLDDDICDLAGLRGVLATRGVLTQDIPLMTGVYDLSEPAGLLAVSEWIITRQSRRVLAAGYTFRTQRALIGQRCRIHPSVRLEGQVTVQHEVTLEEGARIIGPALLGEGVRVGRGATVVGSVIGPGVSVPAGEALLQRVVLVSGSDAARKPSTAEKVTRPAEAVAWPAGHPQHVEENAVPPPGRRRLVQLAVKRTVDLCGALVGLTLLSPLLLLTALLIKLTSPGPVLFVHRREGKGGREFPCLKFRGMVADAHLKQRELYKKNQVDGPQFKLERDPRETRLGRWIRRTNIDELPQLFNVLAGQMSLVGPRPSPFRENQICVSWRQARLSVRPGITGLWQLCRDRRSEGDFHQWIYYDLAYVRHFSVWLDLKILMATLLTCGGRRRVSLSALTGVPERGSAFATTEQEDGDHRHD